MARGKRSGESQSIGTSFKNLFTGLAMAAIVLAMLLFVCYMLEAQTIQQFLTINDYDNETYCDTVASDACTNIREGFDTAINLILMGLGLLGLVIVIVVFVGYILPMVQKSM